jgi:hypothetical protein
MSRTLKPSVLSRATTVCSPPLKADAGSAWPVACWCAAPMMVFRVVLATVADEDELARLPEAIFGEELVAAEIVKPRGGGHTPSAVTSARLTRSEP